MFFSSAHVEKVQEVERENALRPDEARQSKQCENYSSALVYFEPRP